MKYGLRSLMVVVTLACIACGRVGCLMSHAEYHRRELDRYRSDIGPLDGTKFSMISHHERLECEYHQAVYRPWVIVDESFP